MSKYVIAWPHRIGELYFRGWQYAMLNEHTKMLRTANLSEAMLFDSEKVAQDYFDVKIAPDATACVKEVTDKELFHAKLADDPVAEKKRNGISS